MINPLSHMPILGSSNSAAIKDIISKYMDKWGYSYLPSVNVSKLVSME